MQIPASVSMVLRAMLEPEHVRADLVGRENIVIGHVDQISMVRIARRSAGVSMEELVTLCQVFALARPVGKDLCK